MTRSAARPDRLELEARFTIILTALRCQKDWDTVLAGLPKQGLFSINHPVQPGIVQAYTRTQFEGGGVAETRTGLLMRRAWNRQLSGDVMVVTKPYWFFGSGNTGTSHGSPYAYDTNVPLIVMGKRWIKPGYYGQYAEVVDIAPTLAHLLHVRPPSAAEGRVLTETLR